MNALPVTGLSLGGMVSFLFIAISRGWLVPLHTHEAVRQDRDARLAEKDEQIARERALAAERIAREQALTAEWKAAYEKSEEGRSIAAAQNGEMLEGLRTTLKVVDALPKVVEPK